MRNVVGFGLSGLLLMVAAQIHAAVETVADLQREWALITYEVSPEQKADALKSLGEQAGGLVEQHPDDPELLIWQGIVLSSYAGEAGGLGALGAAKRARAALERALQIDPAAMSGSALTSLGTLYHKVPGWPVGFGSDKKARDYLSRALQINADGIDPNYFMGEFLFDEGEYSAAERHLRKALAAPDRPGRALADRGRRGEIQVLLGRVEAKL